MDDNPLIKCPNCGSTTQVEMVWQSCSDGRYTHLQRDYVCSCGCEFVGIFSLIKTIIPLSEV